MFTVHQLSPTLWEVRDDVNRSILRATFPTEAQARIHAAIMNRVAQPGGSNPGGMPAVPPPAPATVVPPPLPPPPMAAQAQAVQAVAPPPPAFIPVPVPRPMPQAPFPVPMPTMARVPIPPPSPYTPLAAFPQNWQNIVNPPPAPVPPPPLPRGQQFGRVFSQAIAATSAFTPHPVAAAARAAFVAAAPEVAIPLAVAREVREAASAAANAMKVFVDRTLDANMALARFNPALATAASRLHMGDFRRSMGLARGTEVSGSEFIRAVDRMRDSLQPFQVFLSNTHNMAGSFVAGGTKGVADSFRPIVDIAEFLRKKLDAGDDWVANLAEVIAHALVSAIAGMTGFSSLLAALEWIKNFLGIKDEDQPRAVGWDAMILGQQPGNPFRMTPLHGGRQFNPARQG